MPATDAEEVRMLRNAYHDLNLIAAEMAEALAEVYASRARRLRHDAEMALIGIPVVPEPTPKATGGPIRPGIVLHVGESAAPSIPSESRSNPT